MEEDACDCPLVANKELEKEEVSAIEVGSAGSVEPRDDADTERRWATRKKVSSSRNNACC